jgi:hypothetical protein
MPRLKWSHCVYLQLKGGAEDQTLLSTACLKANKGTATSRPHQLCSLQRHSSTPSHLISNSEGSRRELYWPCAQKRNQVSLAFPQSRSWLGKESKEGDICQHLSLGSSPLPLPCPKKEAPLDGSNNCTMIHAASTLIHLGKLTPMLQMEKVRLREIQ